MATVMLIRVNVCLEFCLQCREKERKEEKDREKRVREEESFFVHFPLRIRKQG